MAKRARGSSTRPGQRPPIQRTSSRPPTSSASPAAVDPLSETALGAYGGQSLTDADLARAAELEAQIVAEEKATESARASTTRAATTPRATSTLAQSAADEYAYVARDVRRIVLIGGSLVGLLVGAWAVIQVTGASLF